MAKYFACLILVLFALIPTLLYYYSIVQLGMLKGNIDGGAVAGSYIGLVLLGSAFAAIGIFSSSVTKNQVIAFAVAVFLSFIAYSGFDALAKIFASTILEDVFLWLSVNEHFQSMSRGVLDTRDLVYFISFILLFLGLTRLVIGGRKW